MSTLACYRHVNISINTRETTPCGHVCFAGCLRCVPYFPPYGRNSGENGLRPTTICSPTSSEKQMPIQESRQYRLSHVPTCREGGGGGGGEMISTLGAGSRSLDKCRRQSINDPDASAEPPVSNCEQHPSGNIACTPWSPGNASYHNCSKT